MEPLRQRGHTYQQPPRWTLQQTKEACQPPTLQHLCPDRTIELLKKTKANQIQISAADTQRSKPLCFFNNENVELLRIIINIW